jgi:hypothetical protein
MNTPTIITTIDTETAADIPHTGAIALPPTSGRYCHSEELTALLRHIARTLICKGDASIECSAYANTLKVSFCVPRNKGEHPYPACSIDIKPTSYCKAIQFTVSKGWTRTVLTRRLTTKLLLWKTTVSAERLHAICAELRELGLQMVKDRIESERLTKEYGVKKNVELRETVALLETQGISLDFTLARDAVKCDLWLGGKAYGPNAVSVQLHGRDVTVDSFNLAPELLGEFKSLLERSNALLNPKS